MDIRPLTAMLEVLIITIFIAFMFGYIFSTSEGIDFNLKHYSLDAALTIDTMMASGNPMNVTYTLSSNIKPEFYRLSIDGNEICAKYSIAEAGKSLKEIISGFYRSLKKTPIAKCHSFSMKQGFGMEITRHEDNKAIYDFVKVKNG